MILTEEEQFAFVLLVRQQVKANPTLYRPLLAAIFTESEERLHEQTHKRADAERAMIEFARAADFDKLKPEVKDCLKQSIRENYLCGGTAGCAELLARFDQ